MLTAYLTVDYIWHLPWPSLSTTATIHYAHCLLSSSDFNFFFFLSFFLLIRTSWKTQVNGIHSNTKLQWEQNLQKKYFYLPNYFPKCKGSTQILKRNGYICNIHFKLQTSWKFALAMLSVAGIKFDNNACISIAIELQS